jgi:hypothetical protein
VARRKGHRNLEVTKVLNIEGNSPALCARAGSEELMEGLSGIKATDIDLCLEEGRISRSSSP